jgi:hypothetical protein
MAKVKGSETVESDLPKLSAPAQRALAGAGYVRLEQFTEVTAAEVLKLHGVGPNGLKMLRAAMAEKGLSFGGELDGQSG